MNGIQQYVGSVAASIRQENGFKLRELLSLHYEQSRRAVATVLSQQPHWRASSGEKGQYVEAYESAIAGLQPFLKVFREDQGCGIDIEMDEIECIAANLIARKYVKGYISHKLKVMVVHKTSPFPPLTEAILVDDTV
eukprot:jgi/Picre1/35071/NNA_002536.t1